MRSLRATLRFRSKSGMRIEDERAGHHSEPQLQVCVMKAKHAFVLTSNKLFFSSPSSLPMQLQLQPA